MRAEKVSDDLKASMTSLHNAIAKETGERISIGTDWSGAGKAEIIIGNTSRSASEEAAKLLKTDFDYVIKMIGKHIVIMGLNDSSTATAINFFIENFIKDGKIYYPKGKGVVYNAEVKLDSLSIGGVDISEFKFHYIEANGVGGQSTYNEVLAISERLGND